MLVRRLASVAALTAIVTGLAWAGLSAGLFAGFQRRASDSLFPFAATDRNGSGLDIVELHGKAKRIGLGTDGDRRDGRRDDDDD